MASRVSRLASFVAAHLTVTAVVGTMALAPAGAQEPETATLTVSASIAQSCVIENVGDLDFGDLQLGTETGTDTTLELACTLSTDTDTTIEINLGLHPAGDTRRLKADDAEAYIEYMVCTNDDCSTPWPSDGFSHTFVNGNGASVPIYARISSDQTSESSIADSYSDTLVVTLNY